MAYTEVTLTGKHLLPDKTPAAGVIEIIPSEKIIVDDGGNVVLSGRVKVTLDAQGAFSVSLPATDDTRLTPTGFGYTVAAKLHHAHLPAVSFSLPAAVATVDITDVTTVDPSTFVADANYVSAVELAAVDADVTALETTVAAIPATYVAHPAGMPVNTDDPVVLVRLDNDDAIPVNKRVLQIRQDAAQYALKIDHYGTDGHAVDIASHTTSATDADYTVLGVTGYNLDFGTVKFVNNAAQTGGAVVAAWGTDPLRTAPLYVAENWGQGDGFQSVHRAGSSATAFRVSHDGASTFADPAIWLPVRNVSNDVILLENAVAQTSGSLMYLNQSHASSTAPLIRLAQAGSGYLIDATADGFSVDGSGQIRTTQLFNITSFNNAKLSLNTTGTQIVRNVGDGSAVLQVKQDHASGTGDLLSVQTSGSAIKSRFNKGGYFMTRINAAPADADVATGEMAFWFDSTNGASKMMVKAKQADGTVKTASVALA